MLKAAPGGRAVEPEGREGKLGSRARSSVVKQVQTVTNEIILLCLVIFQNKNGLLRSVKCIRSVLKSPTLDLEELERA